MRNVELALTGGIPALAADNQMRQRDERFKDQGKHKAKDDPLYDKQPTAQDEQQPIKRFTPGAFKFNADRSCLCPAGHTLISMGAIYRVGKGLRREDFHARVKDCAGCSLRARCLRHPELSTARQVSRLHEREVGPHDPSERMRQAIDSPRGRQLYSQRLGTVEPVFANLRHDKRLSRFTLRSRDKVHTQWQLYCMVHSIEKLARSGWRG